MSQNGAVWIDLTNSPHVVFFRPIVRRMNEAGVETLVTARDFAQTLGLLRLYGMPHTVIGRHGGARMAGKMVGLVRGSSSLVAWSRGKRLRQAVSHGSNDLAIAARAPRWQGRWSHARRPASDASRGTTPRASSSRAPARPSFPPSARLRGGR